MTRRRALAAAIGLAAAGVLLWRLRPSTADDAPIAEPAAVARLAAWSPSAPAAPLGRVGAYVWAAPLTAAGVLLGAASGKRPRVRDGVLLFADAGGLAGRMLRWRGFQAATLGHAVIAIGQPGPTLFRHELTHVRQAERFGPFFVPLYLAALIRYGYRRNPFERAARLASRAGAPS